MNTSAPVPQWARPSPTGDIVLHDDEAQLWRASLLVADPVADDCWLLLAKDERERAQRFHFPRDRRRFVVGRAVLRTLLSEYTGVPAADLRFAYGPCGKPALSADQNHRGIYFNASGSDDHALYAFTCCGELGVDVERVRPVPEWREIARMASLPGVERPSDFFPAWTRYEARIKATGLGLGQPLPATPRGAEVIHDVPLETGWMGAVALPPGVRRVTRWQWSERFAFAAARS